MEVHDAADMPVVPDALGPAGVCPFCVGNVVGQADREEATSVKIAIPIAQPAIVGVVQNDGAILAALVQSVRPGVGNLGR